MSAQNPEVSAARGTTASRPDFAEWSRRKAERLEYEAALIRRTLREWSDKRDPYEWIDPFEHLHSTPGFRAPTKIGNYVFRNPGVDASPPHVPSGVAIQLSVGGGAKQPSTTGGDAVPGTTP